MRGLLLVVLLAGCGTEAATAPPEGGGGAGGLGGAGGQGGAGGGGGVDPGAPVGTGCSADGDCDPGLFCDSESPGGYCTVLCPDGDCPEGSACYSVRSNTDPVEECLVRCAVDFDCRIGYVCGGSDDNPVCVPRDPPP